MVSFTFIFHFFLSRSFRVLPLDACRPQAAARQGALTSCSSSSSSSSAPIPAPPRRLRTNGKLRRSLLMPASASAANSSPPADWDRTAVVIVDHGSRKAEANAELEEFASLYRCVCVCL